MTFASWWASGGCGAVHAAQHDSDGASASWAKTAHHGAVRAAIAAYVRTHGMKRGLFLAAQAIGMGERAARHAHAGGEFAADSARAARADAARLALLNEQIAQLRAEAAALEIRRTDVEMAGACVDARSGVLHGVRDRMLPAREMTR